MLHCYHATLKLEYLDATVPGYNNITLFSKLKVRSALNGALKSLASGAGGSHNNTQHTIP